MHFQMLLTGRPETVSSRDPGEGCSPALRVGCACSTGALGLRPGPPNPRMWALELGDWRPRPSRYCPLQSPEAAQEAPVEFLLHTRRRDRQNQQRREEENVIFSRCDLGGDYLGEFIYFILSTDSCESQRITGHVR